MQPAIDLHALAPEIALSVTILVVLIADAFLPMPRRWLAVPLAMVGLTVTFVLLLTLVGGDPRVTLGGAFVVDSFALLFKGFFLVAGMAVLAVSGRITRSDTPYPGEYTFLLLCSFLGCLVMPSVRDLVTLFIAIELVSAPVFLLAAFRKGDLRSNEAGIKFFLFGVVASAVMLYGMSLLYGLTGTTTFSGVAEALASGAGSAGAAAVLFVLGGLMFKVSAVPFHFWAPDTYEGSPVPVAAYLSVASKAAGFVGLSLLCFIAFAPVASVWTPVIAIVSMLTMSIGNLLALQQHHIVRLLAYSSIAQAGYMLLPLALVGTSAQTDADALGAVAIYILVYAAMNLGAFAVVVGMSREVPSGEISGYAGLLRRAPLMGIAMTAFLVSLAGIPPAAGFWAKFFVFRVAISAGGMGPWLAGFMVVNSVISLFYYLAVVRTMLQTEPAGEPVSVDRGVRVVALVAAVLVVVWFVMPDLVVNLTKGFTGG